MTSTSKKPVLPSKQCPITDGPSKYDIQASVFDGKVIIFTINDTNLVSTIKIGKEYNATVHFVGAEDGSKESWIGELIVRNTTDTERRTFCYNTRTRKGFIGDNTRSWKM